MKKFLFVLLMALVSAASAQVKNGPKDVPPNFDFRGINVAQVVQLIYSEALKDSYVIDPDVLTDQRAVSFRYDGTKGDLKGFIADFFDSIGLVVSRRNGVDYVMRKPAVQPMVRDAEVFVYRPRYRDGSYLIDILGPLFKGSFTSKRTVHAAPGDMSQQRASSPGSAAASIDRKTDTIVFEGSAVEIEKLKKIMPQVDLASGDVMVRAVMYEVQTSSSDGSAFGLALGLLGGKLGVGIGSILSAAPGQSYLSLRNQAIDAVFSSLSTDGRFKAISKPNLRVRSGETGSFTVGQDVPVLGSITYPGNGQAPVQSITMQSSGVIFDLSPVVHDSSIDLSLKQQVSNFVLTDTGVNGTPTLIKRELKTELSLTDGEVVVLGGLAENKETDARNGLSFIPAFFHTKTADKTNTEIILILQLTKI